MLFIIYYIYLHKWLKLITANVFNTEQKVYIQVNKKHITENKRAKLTEKVISSSNSSEGEQKKLKKNTSLKKGELVDFLILVCFAWL